MYVLTPPPTPARRRVCGVLIYATARNHRDHGNPSFEVTHKRSCNVTIAKQSLTQSHKAQFNVTIAKQSLTQSHKAQFKGGKFIIIMLKLQVNKLN